MDNEKVNDKTGDSNEDLACFYQQGKGISESDISEKSINMDEYNFNPGDKNASFDSLKVHEGTIPQFIFQKAENNVNDSSEDNTTKRYEIDSVTLLNDYQTLDACRKKPTVNKSGLTEDETIDVKEIFTKGTDISPCSRINKSKSTEFEEIDQMLYTDLQGEETKQNIFPAKDSLYLNMEQVSVSQKAPQINKKNSHNHAEFDTVERKIHDDIKDEGRKENMFTKIDSFSSNTEPAASPQKISLGTQEMDHNSTELDDMDKILHTGLKNEEGKQNMFSMTHFSGLNTEQAAMSLKASQITETVTHNSTKFVVIEQQRRLDLKDEEIPQNFTKYLSTLNSEQSVVSPKLSEVPEKLTHNSTEINVVDRKRTDLKDEGIQQNMPHTKEISLETQKMDHNSTELDNMDKILHTGLKNEEGRQHMFSMTNFSGLNAEQTAMSLKASQIHEAMTHNSTKFEVIDRQRRLYLKDEEISQNFTKYLSTSNSERTVLSRKLSEVPEKLTHNSTEIDVVDRMRTDLKEEGIQQNMFHTKDSENNANITYLCGYYRRSRDTRAQKDGVEKILPLNEKGAAENEEFTTYEYTNIPPSFKGTDFSSKCSLKKAEIKLKEDERSHLDNDIKENVSPFIRTCGVIDSSAVTELKQDNNGKSKAYAIDSQCMRKNIECNDEKTTVVEQQFKLKEKNETSKEDIIPWVNLLEDQRAKNNVKADNKSLEEELHQCEGHEKSDEDVASTSDVSWIKHIETNVGDRTNDESLNEKASEIQFSCERVDSHIGIENYDRECVSEENINQCKNESNISYNGLCSILGNVLISIGSYLKEKPYLEHIARNRINIPATMDSNLKASDSNTIEYKQDDESTRLHHHSNTNASKTLGKSDGIISPENVSDSTAIFNEQDYGLVILQPPKKSEKIHPNKIENMKSSFHNKQLFTVDEKYPDIKTLGEALTHFNLSSEIQKLEMSIENVRRRMKSKEKHKKDFNEVDKQLQKLSLRFHPDKVKNREGSDKEIAIAQKLQSALNVTRKVLSILDDAFLENLETDHKYAFYTNLSISSLGNEDTVKNRVCEILFKFGLVSDIKQHDIISEVRKFLTESKLAIQCFLGTENVDFRSHRDSALYHLDCCVEGFEKLQAEYDLLKIECRKDSLGNIVKSITKIIEENSRTMTLLKHLKEVAEISLSDSFEIFTPSQEMDEYFVLPLVCYVDVLLMCSAVLESQSFWNFRPTYPKRYIYREFSCAFRFLQQPYFLVLYIVGSDMNRFRLKTMGFVPSAICSEEDANEQFHLCLVPIDNYFEEKFKICKYEVESAKRHLMEELNKCMTMMSDFKAKEKNLSDGIRNFKRKTDELDEKYEAIMRRTEEFNRNVKESLEKSKKLTEETTAALSREM